jgi:hypothetical protein
MPAVFSVTVTESQLQTRLFNKYDHYMKNGQQYDGRAESQRRTLNQCNAENEHGG